MHRLKQEHFAVATGRARRLGPGWRIPGVLALLWSALAVLPAAAGEGAVPVPAPESAPAVTDPAAAQEAEIARLLRMIFDERSELAAMRREHQAQIGELGAREFALERSIAAWDTELAATHAQWVQAREKRVWLATQLAQRQAVAARWRQMLAAYPPFLQSQMEAGIDYDRAGRQAAAAQLARDCAAAEIAPADLWQRLSRVQDSEEGLARTLEAADVVLSAAREADGLRIGLVLLTAPTPDGGALAIGPGPRPQAETPVAAVDAGGLTAALQVLQRRRSPEFSDVFWPALPTPEAAPPAALVPQPTPVAPPLPPLAAAPVTTLPPAVLPVELPTEAPVVTPKNNEPLAKLEAALSQIRMAKAAYAAAAAKGYQAHIERVGALQKIEAERGALQRAWQAAVAAETEAQTQAGDQLALEAERHTLLLQALRATRDQLIERLNGSLEAAATPAIGERLKAITTAAPDALRAAASDPAVRIEDLEIETLLTHALEIDKALLCAARAAAVFTLAVRLEDGRVIQAQCLQPSLLSGYFADPATREAGLLVTDPREQGVWRGQVKGLSSAERSAIAARILDRQPAGLLPVDVTGGAATIQATHQWNLVEWFQAGGKVMWPLLIVALAGLGLVLERAAALLRLQGRTRDLLTRVEMALQTGQYDRAQQLCDPTRGPVQRVLHAALSHRQDSRAAIEDAIQVTALGELPQLQKGLGMLALLAGLAPLLGLLGTVTGMINTFQMVNLFGSSDTRFLAGGISEALITTEFGLVIAIPLVFAHGILGRLSERILAAIELGAAIVMQRLGNLPSASGVQPAAATGGPKTEPVLVVQDAAPGGGG